MVPGLLVMGFSLSIHAGVEIILGYRYGEGRSMLMDKKIQRKLLSVVGLMKQEIFRVTEHNLCSEKN